MSVVCGKCGSRNIYRDYLPGMGDLGMSCRMCGNVEGSRYGFKEEKMSARLRGTCSNCEREDLMLNPTYKRCGSCESAIIGVKDPAEREKCLKETRERFKGKLKAKCGVRHKKKDNFTFVEAKPPAVTRSESNEIPAQIKRYDGTHLSCPAAKGPIPVAPECVVLPLTDADMDLFKKIEASAVRSRRTVEQQILWIVEQQLGMEVDHE